MHVYACTVCMYITNKGVDSACEINIAQFAGKRSKSFQRTNFERLLNCTEPSTRLVPNSHVHTTVPEEYQNSNRTVTEPHLTGVPHSTEQYIR